ACETCGRVMAGPQPPSTSVPTSIDAAINEHVRLMMVELNATVERTITGILLRMGYLRSKKSSLILEISTQERKNGIVLKDLFGLPLGRQGGPLHDRFSMLFQIAKRKTCGWLCNCAARRVMPATDIKFVLHTTAITARLARWLARKTRRLSSNY